MDKLWTFLNLGLLNIGRVILYRVLTRIGFYKRILPAGESYHGPFWTWSQTFRPLATSGHDWSKEADRVLQGEIPYYSHSWRRIGFPPQWNEVQAESHWTEIHEFNLGQDIKDLWEPSRFDPLLILTLSYLQTGEEKYREAIESWMQSWVNAHPNNLGPQWKCAQEASIRLMHVLMVTDLLLANHAASPQPPLQKFVLEHCRRIAPTMLYAIAQDNNHGTSEAAALYIAGLWLEKFSPSGEARRWKKTARYWLEDRVKKLIMEDGSFSQHSVNYHRLMLDTLTMAEFFRNKSGDKRFSNAWYENCEKALSWLHHLIDEKSGDAPNLGCNDGARIMVLHGAPYRDFRPTVQLASQVFHAKKVYGPGTWDECSQWMQLKTEAIALRETSQKVFPEGGYIRLEGTGDLWAILRLPRFRFRPANADALHFDIWKDGINWIRDGGTFSYNTRPELQSYFSGTASHSTVQFDDRDQMPKYGRFLFGAWPKWDELTVRSNFVRSSYRDHLGAKHVRSVALDGTKIEITDEVSGMKKRAVLRWRLRPGNWIFHEGKARLDGCEIHVVSGPKAVRCEIIQGYESRHYSELTQLPVLELEVDSSARITTIISFRG
jgi:hypothetical protein